MNAGDNFHIPRAGPEFAKASKPRRRGRTKSCPRITLRLTDDEAAQLERLSQGVTVSAFVRERLFGDGGGRRKRRDHKPVADQQAMAQALALLGQSRIANNLNQLAYHANTGTLLIDRETASRINEAYDYVTALRDALLAALGRTQGGRR